MPFFSFGKKKKEEGEEPVTGEKRGFLGGIIKKKEPEAAAPPKEEEHPPELPELPKETPGYNPVISGSEAELIKEAVAPLAEAKPPIPTLPKKKSIIPRFRPKFKREEPKEEKMPEKFDEPKEEDIMAGEKPIFVKIDDYRDVMETIKELKIKMKDAGDILSDLKKLKDEEDNELQVWHDELESIKSKLLLIDKKLFEV